MISDVNINRAELLEYEIRSSILPQYISNEWLQDKISSYYVRRFHRKYARYLESMRLSEKFGKSAEM